MEDESESLSISSESLEEEPHDDVDQEQPKQKKVKKIKQRKVKPKQKTKRKKTTAQTAMGDGKLHRTISSLSLERGMNTSSKDFKPMAAPNLYNMATIKPQQKKPAYIPRTEAKEKNSDKLNQS